ncbi:MAG: glycoside hydrolase family 88 protein [Verrucomicrobiales bacterium]
MLRSFLIALLTCLPTLAQVHHLPATGVEAPGLPIPENLRVPAAWPSAAITPAGSDDSTVFTWKKRDLPAGDTIRLRLSSALDLREVTTLRASLAQSGEALGEFDFNHAPVFQIIELPLSRTQAEKVLSQGLRLTRTAGKSPLHLFAPARVGRSLPPLLQPHLMIAGKSDRWAEFHRRLLADNGTIQTFGWMEGCLLDGLRDLAQGDPHSPASHALSRRLDLFLVGSDLRYEDPRSRPADNRVYGIEGSLPFSVIAHTHPRHPSLDTAVEFWKKHERKSGFAQGSIQDGGTCTAEGSYTVGHALMQVAVARQDPALVELALTQFRVRRDVLLDDNKDLWLRNNGKGRHMKNWARGVTWYYLGLIRGLAATPDGHDTSDLEAEALRMMDFVLAHQQENGLWRNFLHDLSQSVDTSGSAGIAAALAIGARHGILPAEKALPAARRALAGLENHLTADGLLEHGTPSNRSKEASTNKRVIFPVGMGLAAQLIAALED